MKNPKNRLQEKLKKIMPKAQAELHEAQYDRDNRVGPQPYLPAKKVKRAK